MPSDCPDAPHNIVSGPSGLPSSERRSTAFRTVGFIVRESNGIYSYSAAEVKQLNNRPALSQAEHPFLDAVSNGVPSLGARGNSTFTPLLAVRRSLSSFAMSAERAELG